MRNLGAVCSILFDFKNVIKYITCLLGRLYQNISSSVTWKPLGVMSPSAFGIECHRAPGFSCHLGADILMKPKKIFFSVWFLGWKYAKSKNMGMSFKSNFKRLRFGSEILRWFRRNSLRDVLVRIRQFFFYFLWLFNIY